MSDGSSTALKINILSLIKTNLCVATRDQPTRLFSGHSKSQRLNIGFQKSYVNTMAYTLKSYSTLTEAPCWFCLWRHIVGVQCLPNTRTPSHRTCIKLCYYLHTDYTLDTHLLGNCHPSLSPGTWLWQWCPTSVWRSLKCHSGYFEDTGKALLGRVVQWGNSDSGTGHLRLFGEEILL